MAREKAPDNVKQPGKPCLPVRNSKFVRIIKNAQIEDIIEQLTQEQIDDLQAAGCNPATATFLDDQGATVQSTQILSGTEQQFQINIVIQ